MVDKNWLSMATRRDFNPIVFVDEADELVCKHLAKVNFKEKKLEGMIAMHNRHVLLLSATMTEYWTSVLSEVLGEQFEIFRCKAQRALLRGGTTNISINGAVSKTVKEAYQAICALVLSFLTKAPIFLFIVNPQAGQVQGLIKLVEP